MTGRENLTRPPFAIDESLGPLDVAAEIVACFERLASRPAFLPGGHALAMLALGVGPADALHRAGSAVAADIDRGVGAGVPAGYHNPRHFLEVMLCALYLARIAGLDRARSARVTTAALAHDFHHDGSRSSDSPFRLEALAAEKTDDYARDAGVAPELREQLRALVLATEPRTGVPFARACLDHHVNGELAPEFVEAPPPLARLLVEPELALEAVLLAEADVLPSIGLTIAHGLQAQDRLADEWNMSLGAEDKVGFIDRVQGKIIVATFFEPNIEALRQACLRQLPGARR
jgi:hypothetical protein